MKRKNTSPPLTFNLVNLNMSWWYLQENGYTFRGLSKLFASFLKKKGIDSPSEQTLSPQEYISFQKKSCV